ncbi:hypothetical protein OJ997_17980 [Solirubrobacter phytolaccae]|uniref:Uncharacterized protein n=1 Tax=Solirubrobacter phytolaccae TaxID=1404360 RepID=A0A9X3N8Z1_9ACTN|nr:hypothetical protein [Solirubrobacter phytolaccae]MDA0182200.1 hypothetical protein [Solirubrobacter phytolaccae]
MKLLDTLRQLTRGAGNQRWGAHSLLILAPIGDGAREDLLGELARCEHDSPLAGLAEVHFARWVVIDQLKTGFADAPKRPSRLDRPYLLFSADYTPAPGDGTLLERLAEVGAAVWNHCDGFPPDGPARVDYLAAHRCDTTLYYAGYPDATPARVKTAVARRDALTRFVLDHRDERDAATLQRAYLKEAARWF